MLKRIMATTILVAVLALFAITAYGLQPQQQTPQQDQFAADRYPLIAEKRPMTDAELQRLGLHRSRLAEPMFVFNHHRELCRRPGDVCGKWETLVAGTEVAKDQGGRPWYKTDCSNRLFVPWTCSVCPVFGPGWWPFGEGGPQWPWWLPWLLLLVLCALLAWWLWPRRKDDHYANKLASVDPRSTRLPGLGATNAAAGVAATAGTTAAAVGPVPQPVPTDEERLKTLTEEAKASEKKVDDRRKAMADLQKESDELRKVGKRGDAARKDLAAEREETVAAVAETDGKKIQDEIAGLKAKIAAKKAVRARVIEKIRNDLAAAIATEDEVTEEKAMRRLRAFDVVK